MAERSWRRSDRLERLWLNDGWYTRLWPERPNHVWSYDFVADRTHDGSAFRMLCSIDEYNRETYPSGWARKLTATEVIEALCELFVRGASLHKRSDNGWVRSDRSSQVDRCRGCQVRDELLNGEHFYTLKEA
jgi:putative transposase